MKKLLAAALLSTVCMMPALAAELPEGWVIASSEDNQVVFFNKVANARVSSAVIPIESAEDAKIKVEDFLVSIANSRNCPAKVNKNDIGLNIECPESNTTIYADKDPANKNFQMIITTCNTAEGCKAATDFINFIVASPN